MIKIDSPFKVLVSNLKECEINEEGESTLPVQSHRLQNIVRIKFESVWLQGCIDDRLDSNSFILDDGTGKAVIQPLSSVEGDKSWISKGIPCLVLGTLVQQTPVTVMPFKIANLQSNPNHENLWVLEVEEVKSMVCNWATLS